ncbi:uncharacterized protein LOC117002564 [Catharus ustulatus]|uniref:uncharacterized protein LOC117002564 n=1 Tax=Catharus ustulatus TaxID=91951 RepID=UPI00140775BB|nr:uncharacterized protein LOC117002564 [Catharus ustulatus]
MGRRPGKKTLSTHCRWTLSLSPSINQQLPPVNTLSIWNIPLASTALYQLLRRKLTLYQLKPGQAVTRCDKYVPLQSITSCGRWCSQLWKSWDLFSSSEETAAFWKCWKKPHVCACPHPRSRCFGVGPVTLQPPNPSQELIRCKLEENTALNLHLFPLKADGCSTPDPWGGSDGWEHHRGMCFASSLSCPPAATEPRGCGDMGWCKMGHCDCWEDKNTCVPAPE